MARRPSIATATIRRSLAEPTDVAPTVAQPCAQSLVPPPIVRDRGNALRLNAAESPA